MKTQFKSLIKNILCVLPFAVCLSATSSNAQTVQQFVGFSDGNNGGTLDPIVNFDVVNANSILIATVYMDNTTPALTNVRFGNGGGIGSGDVAPDLTITDNRLLSYVFINPSTASGLSFRATNSIPNAGTAAILYEVSGANTTLSSITTATNSTTITTSTASELVVSVAGRNAAAPTEAGFFAAAEIEIQGSTVTGTGSVASASATAPTIGSQDITWTGNSPAGRIAYAFEAAPVAAASPTLTNFSYDSSTGASVVSIKGAPGTRYKLVEADDLNFSTPDQDPIPLTGATVGTLAGNEVVANASGDATIQFNLGTAKAATFLRAETIP